MKPDYRVRHKLIDLLHTRNISEDISSVVHYLSDAGILPEKQILKYLIKDDYYKLLKVGNRSCFDVKLDLSVGYNVSMRTVDNIIYKYKHIII